MIEVKFTGEVVSNKVETFTSKSGNEITKRAIIMENKTETGYVDTLEVVCFGDNADKGADIKEGARITMRGSVRSSEYNGRYFTQVNLYEWWSESKPEETEPVVDAPKVSKPTKPTKQEKPQEFDPQSETDGLPF